MFRHHKPHKIDAPHSVRKRVLLSVEGLEERIVPFALTGNAWPHPNYVTISFVPDGTIVGSAGSQPAYSNLFATLNARFGSPSIWEPQILLAAQNWAAQTNLNLQVVSDNGTSIGQGAYEQGDPNMGDIRISGYNFGGDPTLAYTDLPPPGNNFSLAGDMQFNTAYTWNIGSDYDLYTVAMHEFGHAFGLGDITYDPNASEYAYYDGIHGGLDGDDVQGIRTIYSRGLPRSPDGILGLNGSPCTATDLTGLINHASNTVAVAGLGLSSPQPEWFKITVPSGTVSNPTVLVQSLYQSMLSPTVYVYSSYGVLLASASAGNPYNGSIITASPGGISAGQVLYFEVTGDTSTSFQIGTYALSLNFGTGATPTFAAPNTATPNGSPLQSTGAQNQDAPLAFSRSTAPGVDQTALLQVMRITPGAARAAPVNPLVLSPVGNSPTALNLPAPSANGGQPTAAAPLPEDMEESSPSLPDAALEHAALPAVSPAPAQAQPLQAVRELPMAAGRWAEEATRFFSSTVTPRPKETASSSASPSLALEVTAALAGLVAVAGDSRRSVGPNLRQEKRKQLEAEQSK
jgi:hypothetical protein